MKESLGQVLRTNGSELALVIGNGLLRASGLSSWEGLLEKQAKSHAGLTYSSRKKRDLSLPELFEIMEINEKVPGAVRKQFQSELQKATQEIDLGQEKSNPRRLILDWALRNEAPILTTNFDKTLEYTMGLQKFFLGRRMATDFYPWDVYYSCKEVSEPISGFAIWHIHGVVEYKRSIKMSLADYMAMVSRARGYIFREKDSLFASKRSNKWRGHSTWLDIFFKRKLLFIGLGLPTQEVFLRWLLVQRRKFLSKNNIEEMGVWFVIPEEENKGRYSGRRAFLDALGVKTVVVPGYADIYDSGAWRA